MNSKLLLVIVALIVVFAAFIFFANENKGPTSTNSSSVKSEVSPTPVATQANSEVTNVILGGLGFVPKDITIKPKTTVIWINKSGKVATVSSDDHPTHRLYPFLNLGEFPSSSYLKVVFDKTGKYSYHNHNDASQTGAVTVE